MTEQASYWLYQDGKTFTQQELNQYLAEKKANGKGREGGSNSKQESIEGTVGLHQEDN